MNRRDFIGGCAAGAAAAGLPAIGQSREYVAGASSERGGVTIPAGACVYWSNKSDTAIATFVNEGRELSVECELYIDGYGMKQIRNTGRIVSQP